MSNNTPKKNLLAFCDEPTAPFGFSTAARNILKALSSKFTIAVCTSILSRIVLNPGDNFKRIQSISEDPYRLPFGKNLQKSIQEVKPDAIFFFHDLPIIGRYINTDALIDCPIVAYFPIDGTSIPPSWFKPLHSVTYPVVYTRFAENIIRQTDNTLACRIIPHGHDPRIFFPLSKDKREAKRTSRSQLGFPQEGFFILRVDRNHERKNWPATIEAFSIFAKEHKDAYLIMHALPYERGSYNLDELIEVYDAPRERVFRPILNSKRYLNSVEMNLLYNAADIHVSTTSGGGWELSTHEAQAVGTPAIGTRYASLPEIIAHNDGLIDVAGYYVAARNSVRYAIADVSHCVEILERLYSDNSYYDEFHHECLNWAKSHTWSQPCQQFSDLFSQVVAS